MRKLLALSLVLSLTPVAGAFMLSFYVDGMDDHVIVTPNEPVTISVITDVDTRAFSLSIALSDPFIDYNPIAFNPLFTSTSLSSIGTKVAPNYIKNAGGRMNAPTTDTPVPAGSWVYKFSVTPTYWGWTKIDDYKGVIVSGLAVKTTINGTEIYMDPIWIGEPEPMSIALLGLGGLFLRRKR